MGLEDNQALVYTDQEWRDWSDRSTQASSSSGGESSASTTEWVEDGFQAYLADQLSDHFTEDALEQAKLNCIACLHDTIGLEDMMSNPAHSAQFIQDGLTPCYASDAFNKRKGKGKGKSKYPVRPSTLTIGDRRKKLEELKAKS